jgi:phosphohistidine phosphatase SixA
MSLLRTAARASVATRVIGSTHRRQQQQWAAQDAAPAAEPASATGGAAPGGAAPSVLDQLTQLGDLRAAGVLTDAEFEAQKQRILGG